MTPNVQVDSSITSNQCVVRFRYSGVATVDSGDIALDYSSATGSFGDKRYDVRCRSLIDDATQTTTFNSCDDTCDQGERRVLRMNFTMGQGSQDDIVLDTPADLFECLFEGEGATLADLTGTLHLSGPTIDTNIAALDVDVECDGWPNATTTTSTTTSTLLCDGGPCEAGDVIPVQIWLDDALTLGALQFNVTFSSVVGGFDQYSTPAIKCSLASGVNALFASNQTPHLGDPECVDCERNLAVGFAFGAGFTGPGQLLDCDFIVGQQVPSAEDFSISVVDASDLTFEEVEPRPKVSLRGFPEQ